MFENRTVLFAAEIIKHDLGEVILDQSELSEQLQNVGQFTRRTEAIVKVFKRSNVQKIMTLSARYNLSLFPFSRGCNWGYGSKLPVKDGAVLLDLSGLDKIISIDDKHGVATIEPGVTQIQLAEELLKRKSRYFLDVTGSGAYTSVLGNSLERGVAYGSLRAQQLAGLEAVLGDGSVIRTGFGDYENPALAGLYSYGLGPSLDGLFFQSNLGIVTEGKLQLTLRPEKLVAISIAVSDKNINQFVEEMAELKRTGIIHGIPHLADRERLLSTLTPLVMQELGCDELEAQTKIKNVIKTDWVLTTSVAGPAAIAKQKLQLVKKRVSKIGKIYAHDFTEEIWKKKIKEGLIQLLSNSDQKTVIKASEKLRGFHQGIPSNAGIQFLLNNESKTVDKSKTGFLLYTPLAPLSGDNAELFYKLTAELANTLSVKYAMTLNMVSDRVLEAVISVHFDNQIQAEVSKAHDFVDALNKIFSVRGFYPYRININEQARNNQKPSGQSSLVLEKIKKVLDPNGVIAPGRYV